MTKYHDSSLTICLFVTGIIRACAKAKMSRKAIQLLEDAKNNNAPLDAFIYTAVIDGKNNCVNLIRTCT